MPIWKQQCSKKLASIITFLAKSNDYHGVMLVKFSCNFYHFYSRNLWMWIHNKVRAFLKSHFFSPFPFFILHYVFIKVRPLQKHSYAGLVWNHPNLTYKTMFRSYLSFVHILSIMDQILNDTFDSLFIILPSYVKNIHMLAKYALKNCSKTGILTRIKLKPRTLMNCHA